MIGELPGTLLSYSCHAKVVRDPGRHLKSSQAVLKLIGRLENGASWRLSIHFHSRADRAFALHRNYAQRRERQKWRCLDEERVTDESGGGEDVLRGSAIPFNSCDTQSFNIYSEHCWPSRRRPSTRASLLSSPRNKIILRPGSLRNQEHKLLLPALIPHSMNIIRPNR